MEKFIEFMKRNYKSLVVVAALSALLWGFIPFKKQVDGDKDKMLMELLTLVRRFTGSYSMSTPAKKDVKVPGVECPWRTLYPP